MFGIDPIANRRKRDQMALQELQNKGQLDVTKEQNTGAMTLAQWNALAAHAKTLGISPDTIAELKPQRLAIDKTTLDTADTNAKVGDVQAKQRGSMYGVNPTPVGMNPDVQEGGRRSIVAEAVNPANKAAKDNAIDVRNPQLRQDPFNPLSFGVTPFLGENKTGSYFDTKTGQMIPEQSSSALRPGLPIPDEFQRQKAEQEVAVAKAANLRNPMFGRGLGVLAPQAAGPVAPQIQPSVAPQEPTSIAGTAGINLTNDLMRKWMLKQQQMKQQQIQPVAPSPFGIVPPMLPNSRTY